MKKLILITIITLSIGPVSGPVLPTAASTSIA